MVADQKKKKLSGAERAAVLLMSLGQVEASEVMKHMNPKEVQAVGEAIAAMGQVDKDMVANILNEFHETVEKETALGVGSDEYLRSVLVDALGEEKANNLLDRILLGRHSKGLDSLKWMEPRAVAEIIRLEHPQIIAIILSYLESDHAGSVLAALPENMQTDVLIRISSLDGIQPSAINELDEMLEQQFSGNAENIKSSAVGGLKTAANLLNFVDTQLEIELMEKIRDYDEEMADGIQDLMFVFDNLVDIDDRGIQVLLREVSSDVLIIALKGADDEIKEKIFKNMSKRAGDMLREDLEGRGPVRLSEVEGAQREILSIARRMSDAGEITLGGKGGDEFV